MPTEDLLTGHDTKQEGVREPKFNYQGFLGLLKQAEARDIVTAIRKFIEAYKQEWSLKLGVAEQVVRYREYLEGLGEATQRHPVWQAAGEEARALAPEGIEYMTMNQIHAKAFCPRNSDDRERDEALEKKMALFQWVCPEHLDISGCGVTDDTVAQAGTEFARINEYTTPRDKQLCLSSGIRILHKADRLNADVLMPLIIMALIRARPARLYSNLQYISRFRNARYTQGETAYNMTTLLAAMTFIEKLDQSALKVGEAEFTQSMEASVAAYNEELLERQEAELKRHEEEMARREAEMIRSDWEAHEEQRGQSPQIRRSSSAELKVLIGDLEENGSKLMQKVRESSFVKQGKGFFQEFLTEAKSAVKSLVDESDDDEDAGIKKSSSRPQRTLQEEEEYQLQLALALSLSENEAHLEKGKDKLPVDREEAGSMPSTSAQRNSTGQSHLP